MPKKSAFKFDIQHIDVCTYIVIELTVLWIHMKMLLVMA